MVDEPAPVRRQERAVRTLEAIIRGAGVVFDVYGYEGSSLTRILEEAEVTKGALYHHFRTKQELAQELVNRQTTIITVPPRRVALQELLDMAFAVAETLKHDPVMRGSVRLSTDQTVPPGSDYSGPYKEWPKILLGLLERARAQGELLPTVEPQEVVEMIVGCFGGLQIMSQKLTQRDDVGKRISVFFRYVLPSVAVPALLPVLDVAEDRGRRVLAEHLAEEPVGPED